MRKTIFIISLLVIASSCSMNSPEMIKQQITKKTEQVNKINEQIALLEAMAEPDTADAEEGFMVPVSLKMMDPEPFEHFIEVTGSIEAEEDAFISPEMSGQIKHIYVKEGETVKQGQLLVSLNTAMIESSIREVQSGLTLTTKLFEKQQELWDQNIGSEMQYLESKNAKESMEARLESLKAQLDMSRIKAPFSGQVETIMRKEGELAAPGMQVIQLVSLNKLKLYANISERYMSSIHEGDVVGIHFPDAQDMGLQIPIHRIGNMIDDKSRTFRIEMKIDNDDRKLKPNMYTTIKVRDFSTVTASVLPAVAIKQDIQGNYVFLAVEEEGQLKARKKYITMGLSYNDLTMISEGVSPGDRVIIKGFSQVSDGVGVVVK